MLINPCFYVFGDGFISLRVVDAMLPITAKLAIIVKLELVNTQYLNFNEQTVQLKKINNC